MIILEKIIHLNIIYNMSKNDDKENNNKEDNFIKGLIEDNKNNKEKIRIKQLKKNIMMIKIILQKILLNRRILNINNEKSIKMKIKMIKYKKK